MDVFMRRLTGNKDDPMLEDGVAEQTLRMSKPWNVLR